jgi:hypothetical protein
MKPSTRWATGLAVAATAVLLAGCGEKPQKAGTKVVGQQPWQGTQNGHMLPGWKTGDRKSWEDQMRARAQAQNEYTRTTRNP